MGNEIERKLATIERVTNIEPIEGADVIVAATIRGWKVVVKKEDFRVGDLAVFFEIDSFLPIDDRYEFLRKSSYRKMGEEEGFRLKTCKLRGQVSQGLAIPLERETFPELFPSDDDAIDNLWDPYEPLFREGDDVTGVLMVELWEPPIPACLGGRVRGNFPSFIRKTDQDRVQNIYNKFKHKYEHLTFEATVKLDGTSMTVYFKDGLFGVCSRNLDLIEDADNTYWKVALNSGLREKLYALGKNIAIQGEVMGEGIQGNREDIKGQQLFVFDVFNIDTQCYFTSEERAELTEQLGLKHIPVLSTGMFPFAMTLEELLTYAEGESLNNPIREGVVFKSTEVCGSEIPSFKVISNTFLLKEK